MAYANKFNGMVLATGNKSEWLLVTQRFMGIWWVAFQS